MQATKLIQHKKKPKRVIKRKISRVILSNSWWEEITHVLIDMDGTLIRQPGPLFFNLFACGVLYRMKEFGTIPELIRAANKTKQILLSPHTFPSNEEAFFETLASELNSSKEKIKIFMSKFFNSEYPFICLTLKIEPYARDLIDTLRMSGRHITLATNPVFGKREIELRLKVSQLFLHDFDHVTSWDTMKTTKPHPDFFHTTLKKIGAASDKTVMIGNDPYYDLPAHKYGIQTLLVGKRLSLKDIVKSLPQNDF